MSEAPPPPPPPIDDDAPPPPPPSEEDIEKHPLVLQLRREVAQLRAQLSDTASAVSVVLRDLRMIRDDANALCTNSVDHAEIFSTGSSGSAQSFGSNLVSDSFPNQTSLSLTNLQPKTLKRQPGAPLGFKISDRVIVTALAVGGPGFQKEKHPLSRHFVTAALAGLGLGDWYKIIDFFFSKKNCFEREKTLCDTALSGSAGKTSKARLIPKSSNCCHRLNRVRMSTSK